MGRRQTLVIIILVIIIRVIIIVVIIIIIIIVIIFWPELRGDMSRSVLVFSGVDVGPFWVRFGTFRSV